MARTRARSVSDPFEAMPGKPEETPRPTGPVRTEFPPTDSPDPETYDTGREKRDAADHNPVAEAAVKNAGPVFDPDALTDNIVKFAEKITGIPNFKFYKYQEEFARRLVYAILMNEPVEITVLIARQAGKTESVTNVIVACSILLPMLAKVFPEQLGQFGQGFWAGVFAPRDWQVQTDVERISGRLKAPITLETMKDPDLGISIMKKMTLSNGSQVFAHTANPQTFIESKTLHLLVIEEGQDMDKTVIQKSLHPMVASTAGPILKIGTAGTKRCEFLEAINRNKRKSLHFRDWRKRLHFEYDYRICQQYNKRYKLHIEREKELLGEESDAFRMSYGLVWILERGMFTSPLDLDQLEDRKREHLVSFSSYLQSDHAARTIAGLDIGKSKDSTVLTIGCGYTETANAEGFFLVDVIGWFEFVGDDHESQYHQIVPILREFRVATLSVDSTGVGDVHADRYAANLPEIAVLPVVFSTPMKSTLYKTLDREMRARRISIPAGKNTLKSRVYKRFRQQMEDLEKEYKGAYMLCHHPKDDTNAHDDFPDSLALMLNSAYAQIMPSVEQTMSSLMAGSGRNWLMRG